MDTPSSQNWGPIITVVIALCTAVYALLKKLFTTVGRDEFERAMDKLKNDQGARFDDLSDRLDAYHKQNIDRMDKFMERRR